MTNTAIFPKTKSRRRPPARINAVVRGRAVGMTKIEHQFKRYNRQYPQVADAFAEATVALARITLAPPTAVGALGITRAIIRAKGTLPRVKRFNASTARVSPGLPNELAPYYARLFNARHSGTTGIRYETRIP